MAVTRLGGTSSGGASLPVASINSPEFRFNVVYTNGSSNTGTWITFGTVAADALILAWQGHPNTAGARPSGPSAPSEVELGAGASGSESTLVTFQWSMGGTGNYPSPGTHFLRHMTVPILAPSGTRLCVRTPSAVAVISRVHLRYVSSISSLTLTS